MTEAGLENFWREVAAVPVARHLANASAQLESIDVGGALVPVVVHTPASGQTNLCSLRTHFIDYAREETKRLEGVGSAARLAMRAGLAGLERLGRACALDEVVTVNNLLLTTCLYPELPAGAVARATLELSRKFPGRAIAWRSVVRELNAALIAELRAAGALLLPWRSIYLSSPGVLQSALRDSRDARRDVALARRLRHDYRWSEGGEFNADDWMRATRLFRLLYREKYSRYNPDYTAAFFQSAHVSGAVRMIGLRSPEGRLDGVVGLYRRVGVQAAPFLGYDTALPRDLSLYRLLCAKHWIEAMDAGCWAHQSAGVATFKKNRRATPAVEYVAVCARHLSPRRRVAWAAFVAVIRHVVLPVVRCGEK